VSPTCSIVTETGELVISFEEFVSGVQPVRINSNDSASKRAVLHAFWAILTSYIDSLCGRFEMRLKVVPDRHLTIL
jgi:hypothetical protein